MKLALNSQKVYYVNQISVNNIEERLDVNNVTFQKNQYLKRWFKMERDCL